MSADLLREAAAKMRDEWSLSPAATFCQCEDTDAWFDRSICPEPCDSMHNICVECGLVQGYCSVAVAGRDNGNRLALSWLAVADWLDTQVARWEQVYADTQRPSPGVDEPPAIHYGDTVGAANTANHHTRHARTVARAYLGSDQ